MSKNLLQITLIALLIWSGQAKASVESNRKLIQLINTKSYFVKTFSFRPTLIEAKNQILKQAANPKEHLEILKLIDEEIKFSDFGSQDTSDVLSILLSHTQYSLPSLVNENIKMGLQLLKTIDTTQIFEGRRKALTAINSFFLSTVKNANLMTVKTMTSIFEGKRGSVPAVAVEVKLKLLKNISERKNLTAEELLTIATHIQKNMKNEKIYNEEGIGCDSDLKTCEMIIQYNKDFITKAYTLSSNRTINYCASSIKDYAIGFAQGAWTTSFNKEDIEQDIRAYSANAHSMSFACIEIAEENLTLEDIRLLHSEIIKATYSELSERVRRMSHRRIVITKTKSEIQNYLSSLGGQNIDWKQDSILVNAQKMTIEERVQALKNLRILLMHFEAQ